MKRQKQYRVEIYDYNKNNLEQELNRIARQGWELVTVLPVIREEEYTWFPQLIFRRKTDDDQDEVQR
jgi:hypothetical protein